MRLLARRPDRYTTEQRARLANQYDNQARIDGQTARQLESAGNHSQAEIHRRTAREWRSLADAARTSSRALERLT